MSLRCEEFFFIETTPTKNEVNLTKNEVNPTKNEPTPINNINTIDPFKDVETFLNTFYHYC